MKGVSFSGLGFGAKFSNGTGIGVVSWRAIACLFVGLFLSSLFGASGLVSGVATETLNTTPVAGETHVEITIGTITLEIVRQLNEYDFTYRQGEAESSVAVVHDSQGVSYSIDSGPWTDVPMRPKPAEDFLSIEALSRDLIGDSANPLARTTWWDGVRFVKGYPAAYAHPDRDYYRVFPKYDWDAFGYRLLHYQFGTATVGLLASLGPFAIGAVIGAAIGSVFAPGIGTIVGAIVGTIAGGVLSYAYNVALVDEAGTIWWWINRSLFTAIKSAPWWLWWCGPCMQAYIASNIDYLRVGSFTGHNELRIWGP